MWQHPGRRRKSLCGGALAAALLMLAPAPAKADPVMEAGLERLAGTLGAVHYLRTLCRPNEGQVWRDRMVTLLGRGDLKQAARDRMVAAFNAGYSRQQSAHKRCTPAAANLGNTYAREGAAEANRLADRIGPRLES
ncbi:TIGR02301 family protein [Pyruvatibacter mobilis]|uniref:TIGR02301 family protein n=1 Tax=Pyruvatibacter mobilis TaxID=1712261 RepID=UPI003BB0F25F